MRTFIGASVLAFLIAVTTPADAQRLKAGVLTCDVSAGMGFIIGSSKTVSCVYRPDQAGPTENYTGTFSRFGLDIGATAAGVMIWAVFTESSAGPGFLSGDYVGATAEATLAAGLGANVLIGGSNRTVALQPLSVSGQVGLNFAVGLADLHLELAR